MELTQEQYSRMERLRQIMDVTQPDSTERTVAIDNLDAEQIKQLYLYDTAKRSGQVSVAPQTESEASQYMISYSEWKAMKNSGNQTPYKNFRRLEPTAAAVFEKRYAEDEQKKAEIMGVSDRETRRKLIAANMRLFE